MLDRYIFIFIERYFNFKKFFLEIIFYEKKY
jgi:hypothetical protein